MECIIQMFVLQSIVYVYFVCHFAVRQLSVVQSMRFDSLEKKSVLNVLLRIYTLVFIKYTIAHLWQIYYMYWLLSILWHCNDTNAKINDVKPISH